MYLRGKASSCDEFSECDELCVFNSFGFRGALFLGGALVTQLEQYHLPNKN